MKVRAQVDLNAAELVDIYQSDTYRMLTGFVVCNRTNATISFRLSLASQGEADSLKQYLFYDTPILPNDTFISGLEIGLATGDVVRAYASVAGVSITLMGAEWS